MKPVSIYAKTKKEIEPKIKKAMDLYLSVHPEIKAKQNILEMIEA